MASTGSAAPAGPNVFKNILVGVITTVLGAGAIYIFGFHDSKSKEEKKLKKEATMTAWNSLFQYEKLFQQTANKMVCLGETETASKEVTDEMEQVINDMGNIKDEDNVDNRMKTLVGRRMESYKKRKELITVYYNDVMALIDQGQPDAEAYKQVVVIQKKLGDKVAAMDEKDGAYIKEMRAAIEKEYDIKLEVPEINMDIKKENLTGKWELNRSSNLEINATGGFTITSGTEKASGTWSLIDESLDFNFSDGSKMSYTVKSLDKMVLRLIDKSDGSFAIGCRN